MDKDSTPPWRWVTSETIAGLTILVVAVAIGWLAGYAIVPLVRG